MITNFLATNFERIHSLKRFGFFYDKTGETANASGKVSLIKFRTPPNNYSIIDYIKIQVSGGAETDFNNTPSPATFSYKFDIRVNDSSIYNDSRAVTYGTVYSVLEQPNFIDTMEYPIMQSEVLIEVMSLGSRQAANLYAEIRGYFFTGDFEKIKQH